MLENKMLLENRTAMMSHLNGKGRVTKQSRQNDFPPSSLTGVGLTALSLTQVEEQRYNSEEYSMTSALNNRQGLWKRGTQGLCRRHELLKLMSSYSCQDSHPVLTFSCLAQLYLLLGTWKVSLPSRATHPSFTTSVIRKQDRYT